MRAGAAPGPGWIPPRPRAWRPARGRPSRRSRPGAPRGQRVGPQHLARGDTPDSTFSPSIVTSTLAPGTACTIATCPAAAADADAPRCRWCRPSGADRHGPRNQRQSGARHQAQDNSHDNPPLSSQPVENQPAGGGVEDFTPRVPGAGIVATPQGWADRVARNRPATLGLPSELTGHSSREPQDDGGRLMRRVPIAAIAVAVTALLAAACGTPVKAGRRSRPARPAGRWRPPSPIGRLPPRPAQHRLRPDGRLLHRPAAHDAQRARDGAPRGVVRQRLRRRLAVLRLAQRHLHRAVPAPDRRPHQHQQPAQPSRPPRAAGAPSPPTATSRAPSPWGCRSRAT